MYIVNDTRSGRSVNDYDTPDSLRRALMSMDVEQPRPPVIEGLSDVTVTLQTDNGNAFDNDDTDNDVVRVIIDDDTVSASLRSNRLESIDSGSSNASLQSDFGPPILDWVLPEYDENTTESPSHENELRRLAVLKSYRILDSGRESSFERLTALACRAFKAPIALAGVIDLGRHYFLSSRGLGGGLKEIPRNSSFCAHTIMCKDDLLVIADTTVDSRFQHIPLVTEHPYVRFYAGAPLISPEGFKLGTLSVMDTKPRPNGITLDEKQNLRELADLVMEAIVDRRQEKYHELRNPAKLISCTAHDLLTPLMGVCQSLSVLQQDTKLQSELSSQQKDVIDTAAKCSSVMNKICLKTLDTYSGIQKDKKDPLDTSSFKIAATSTEVSIKDLVKNLQLVMEPFPKQVPLIMTTDPSVPPVFIADDLKIFRAAINYLTNACSNTESGSVHFKIFSQPRAENKQHLVFECEDTGSGVPVEMYPKLFKSDASPMRSNGNGASKVPIVATSEEWRKSGACQAASESQGMGLYSIATQMKEIGGDYGYRPRCFTREGEMILDKHGNPKRGSIFWFSIPLVLPESSTANEAEQPSFLLKAPQVDALKESQRSQSGSSSVMNGADDIYSSTNGNGTTHSDQKSDSEKELTNSQSESRTKRALIIEDSTVTRKVMVRVLTKLGFEVNQAVNGMEGLKEMQTYLFDLVLCDFLMPVMDGLDCVQQYRQYEVSHRPWFEQYIIGMSAHASDNDIEKGLNCGMNDFLPKPVTLKHLKTVVESEEYKLISEKLDEFALDALADSNSTMNNQNIASTNSMEKNPSTDEGRSVPVCLVAEESDELTKLAENAAISKGWKAVIVQDGEAALKLLKMRNWDAVLLDDELPGLTSCRCVKEFREWETTNRVNRQKNVMQVSSSFIPSFLETSSSVQLPAGFDGVLGKPLCVKTFKTFLDKAAAASSCESSDIVSR